MLHLLIYDKDKDYIEHLVRQLSKLNTERYQFTACSTIETFETYIANATKWDAIICDPKMLDLSSLKSYTGPFVFLVDQYSDNQISELLKYQNVGSFIDQLGYILGIKSNFTKKEVQRQVIMILSGEGGAGKSTVASAMAKLLSERHETLLLSFEVYSDLPLTLETSVSKSMTDLFYYVKKQDGGWLKGFRNQFVKDDYLEFTVANPFSSTSDLESLTKTDIDIFFKTLITSCDFTRVVIDTSSVMSPSTTWLLEHVDTVWVVEGIGQHSAFRNSKLMGDLSKLRSSDSLSIYSIKNCPTPQGLDNLSGVQEVALPFDPTVRNSFRGKAYALGGIPYYKVLSELIEGRS